MLLVGGENLIDFIQADVDAQHPIYQANPGGSPYNCAKAMGRQNVSVGYGTPISADSLGDLLAAGLISSGVTLCGPRRNEPSSLAVVSLVEGIAEYQFYRQDTAERKISKQDLDEIVPRHISAFHLGSLAITSGADAEIWADFYVDMKQRGVFTSLDPNIRASFIADRSAYMERLDRLLVATDLLKLSDEDLAWLYPGISPELAAKKLADRSGAKLTVLTMGADGAMAFFDGNEITVNSANVREMKDTVGAGDTFMASLLVGLENSANLGSDQLRKLMDLDVRSLLERAAIAAALNCEKTGCDPPTQEEIDARLAET